MQEIPDFKSEHINMTELEDTLYFQLQSVLEPAVTVEREYKFHPIRMWRADFALPEYHVLVEVQGGIYKPHTGHNTPSGLIRDYKKANEAAILGWCYLQFDRAAIESGEALNTIIRAMGRAR